MLAWNGKWGLDGKKQNEGFLCLALLREKERREIGNNKVEGI